MLLEILEEHLEETEILWSRRRSALGSPELDLAGLEALEARLHAHLEGVALGVRQAPGGLEERLRGHDADEAFAAAAALLEARGRSSREHVLDALLGATLNGRAGIVEALCHLALAEETELALQAMVDSVRDARLAPAIEVLSFHRLLSPPTIEAAVSAEDAGTRRAAARAIGSVEGEPEWTIALSEDADTGVRDAALVAAARLGQPWVLERLRGVCRDGPVTSQAVRLLACLGDGKDAEALQDLARRAEAAEAEAAVAGLGTLGFVECVEPLLELVDDARLAPAAGLALRRVTGLALPGARREPVTIEIENATFEDLRPAPDADAVRAAWRERAHDFDRKVRWRNGQPLVTERWRAAPHHGDLLTRREELTRLWAHEPDLFRDLELDAPAARQRAVVA